MSESPNEPKTDAKKAREQEILAQRIGNALGGLNSFADKVMRGCEPNAHEVRQALMGCVLMADRNTKEFVARLDWHDHNWLYRLWHRKQRPRFKNEVVGR